MGVLSGIEPAKVFEYFEEICSVPHGSGNTKKISDLCASFAKDLGLKYVQDELNNLIIYKPGSAGRENEEPVILQGHMDMVCAKTAGCTKDMAEEGLDIFVDGDFVRAKDTSLGGDDGIAVAMILALLSDGSCSHPPIEAVFTVDEEVGMDGAAGLDMSLLKGRRMLNLDSEDEGIFTVSCAGGLRTDCSIPVDKNNIVIINDSRKNVCYKVTIGGLIGGHSGCEIDKGRANAIKMMSRFLYGVSDELKSLKMCNIEGGKFDNVICNNCEAEIVVDCEEAGAFEELAKRYDTDYKNEFAVTDPGISLTVEKINLYSEKPAFSTDDTLRFTRALFLVPQGIIAMSSDIKGLVQTSANLGIVKVKPEKLQFSCSVRSSVASQKFAVRDRIEAAVTSQGGYITTRGDYPGWAYRKDSKVRDVLCRLYEEESGKKPVITAIHAGLECGLFSEALPGLDCVSIGPDLKDIHSVNERMSISSVERLYKLVRRFLEEI
ncbi:MAG: aminoacyl-histidine dipeptidase [Lachnospiraceae bacterium]|nr:aminoacyl-histidine dipeptidase [Lachnospiraceae bacterium]